MNHHITLRLANGDDFKLLRSLIEGSGFQVLRLDNHAMEMECQIDNFVLSLVEKYLDAEIDYRESPVVKLNDKLSRETKLVGATG